MPCLRLGQRLALHRHLLIPSASAPLRGCRRPASFASSVARMLLRLLDGILRPPIHHSAASGQRRFRPLHPDPAAYAVASRRRDPSLPGLQAAFFANCFTSRFAVGESCAPLPVQCLTRSRLTRSDSRPCGRLRVVEAEPLEELAAAPRAANRPPPRDRTAACWRRRAPVESPPFGNPRQPRKGADYKGKIDVLERVWHCRVVQNSGGRESA